MEQRIKYLAKTMLEEAKLVGPVHNVKGPGWSGVRTHYNHWNTPQWYVRISLGKKSVLKGLRDLIRNGAKPETSEGETVLIHVREWREIGEEIRAGGTY